MSKGRPPGSGFFVVLDSAAAALASIQLKQRLTNAEKVLRQMQDAGDTEEFAQLDAGFTRR